MQGPVQRGSCLWGMLDLIVFLSILTLNCLFCSWGVWLTCSQDRLTLWRLQWRRQTISRLTSGTQIYSRLVQTAGRSAALKIRLFDEVPKCTCVSLLRLRWCFPPSEALSGLPDVDGSDQASTKHVMVVVRARGLVTGPLSSFLTFSISLPSAPGQAIAYIYLSLSNMENGFKT